MDEGPGREWRAFCPLSEAATIGPRLRNGRRPGASVRRAWLQRLYLVRALYVVALPGPPSAAVAVVASACGGPARHRDPTGASKYRGPVARELDVAEFRRWREQADRALETARLAAVGGQPDWACFLAEQGAQLGAKGLLHGIGEEAWGHDLVVIVNRAGALLEAAWATDVGDEAARLSRHYIPARYPDAHPSGPPGSHYREADATQAMADAERVLAAIDRAWLLLVEEPG